MDLKEVLKKIKKAEDDKTRLEEKMKMLKEKEEEINKELKALGMNDISDIDSELERLQKGLQDTIKKLDSIPSVGNDAVSDAGDDIDLESFEI